MKKTHNQGMRAGTLVALFISALCFKAQADEPPDVIDLNPVLRPILKRSGAPAVAAAVYRKGSLVAMGVCGVRSIETRESVTPADRWPIGSCSKPMARLVFARLMERGVIKSDSQLSELLKGIDMRDVYNTVTLADLMSHRAGIQPYTEIGPKITPIIFDRKGTAIEQRERFTKHVLNEAPAAPPKKRFVYSNAGFCILAVVAERATGKPWETLVAEEVFGPLGLESATEGGEGVQLAGHMKGPNGGLQAARPFPRLAVMIPAGGVSLSIADFAAFAFVEAELEAGHPVAGLTKKTLSSLPELRPADMGPANRGGAMFFGGDGQYTAAFATWPKDGVAIAVACNQGDSDDLCTEMAGAVRAAVVPDVEAGDTSGPRGPRVIKRPRTPSDN
ncbi:MAG: beta-lactamase family protein [Planctomycetes bacterium]|nr:beta-lactamase family protein [Planctomycetota bacterium]